MKPRIGCILMAAGNSERFGRNKLMLEFEGKPLYERALYAVPKDKLEAVAVISQYEDILRMARSLGFIAVLNDRPDDGVSHTIHLGMDALEDQELDALMFMVADQPMLSRESLVSELEFFAKEPGMITAMGDGDRRGNPAIFPREFFADLRKLNSDDGGSRVISAHENALRLYQIGKSLELFDVDTAKELHELKALVHA